jgi:uncharacterized protein (DUF849 family)
VKNIATCTYRLHRTRRGRQQDTGPLYVKFVMGVMNAMPADEAIFDVYVATLKRLSPDALWCAAGIGPDQLRVNEWSIAKGGHTRTSLEGNMRLDRDRLAPSNAALVRRAAALRKARPTRRDLAAGAGDAGPRACCFLKESGFPKQAISDSNSVLVLEASIDDTTLFGRTS